MKTQIKHYGILAIVLIAGIFLGWLFFHNSHSENEKTEVETEAKETIWTCSMHPQIRMDKPGLCPICAMDLIPLSSENHSAVNDDAIQMTEEAIQLANVSTSVVSKMKATKDVRLFGKIQSDERLVQTQSAHIAGRIEKLFVNFTGEKVSQGQVIASIYSPELVTAQNELLELLKMKNIQNNILEASRQKLRQWKLSDEQISEIEKSGVAKNNFEIKATTSGIVISKNVNVGDYVTQGMSLYEIANLSSVWALFDAYETDLPWIKVGDKIDFTVQSLPGNKFSGTISFIDPVINSGTRVSKLRVEVNNSSNELMPEMFITGNLEANLKNYDNSIVIPQSSVLWTGKRSIVYLKMPDAKEPTFIMQEVTLGPSLGSSYVITEGLKEGDEVVTNGAFSIDASAQLAGKPSMMNIESTPDDFKFAEMKVYGECEMCKDRIEKTVNTLYGISKASWDVKTKMLSFYYDAENTVVEKVHKAVANAGHDTEKEKATDDVYNALPGCCKYRDK